MAAGTRCLNSNIGGVTEVLQGKCVGFINLVGHMWDFVGALAVQEAGGVALSPDGKGLRWDTIQMSLLAAANQGIANEMLAVSTKWPEYGQHHWK
jgi:fructose-1,6-bisphosphatase/inositol monophosphatase family enzyme